MENHFGRSEGISLSLLSEITLPCANLCLVLESMNFNPDRTKLTVAHFICWVVSQTVLRTNFRSYPRERRTRVLQTVCIEILPAARLRQFIHFTSSKIVEVTTNLHSFK